MVEAAAEQRERLVHRGADLAAGVVRGEHSLTACVLDRGTRQPAHPRGLVLDLVVGWEQRLEEPEGRLSTRYHG